MGFIAYVFSSALWFAVGRFSYICWRNSYLEEKRQELMAKRDELLAIGEALKQEEDAIRKKWQNMVVDISKYEFANKNSGIWTDADDIYFSSWNSAEK